MIRSPFQYFLESKPTRQDNWKAVRVNQISVLKACGGNQFLQRISPPTTPPPVAAPSSSPTQLSRSQMPRPRIRILPSNPCLDLFFHRPMGSGIHSKLEFHETLMKQLLSLAWSYNPLTTLKLIYNFLDHDGEKRDSEAFNSAAFWLHQNHPKTLSCNLLPIAGAWGHIIHVLETLSRVLLQGNAQLQVDQYSMTWTKKDKNQQFQSKQFQIQLTQNERRRTTCPLPPPSPRQTRQIKVEKAKEKASTLLKRRKTTAMANKAADRYHSDPDYRFLQNRVSDLMAECLKHDIQQFNQHQQQRLEHGQKTLGLNITSVARCSIL
ncbi:PREDICTED: LOW QUALITY PROTEIN [Prunus dulcis]|uniref:PREDICTED: LOW QUALITY PROTEIN n=1 Tax=Prunus dulcis TaxID=3755 RepID=A0A5E4F3N5_PRUDU|nr:PREDICTED: LOW QUALITY PROTEIN [Prunus dulcis]